ncbi:ImmA/IrrE family metallo-endopeptidase [Streptomyces sp. CAI-121]|uniref:helix-turn-helix domain-containing protein n=1 Tax=unclassified Streptomyces TaxID=2593676 RepID=UPI0015876099|nr:MULTISPECIES: XRE family transcriptional regulator [unclassified Streptomyces]NUV69973.1 ImmA/IrrE family metallo-endopeptidase [Streptomyces sp. CAI-121]NUW16255.1 ImmA/IrrE family metallo-endopeptidase [Streptomyces sp. CAI-68]
MTLSHEILAQRVRESIAAASLTQQELAEAVGISPSALSRALAGKRNFKSLEIALIADHLGVSVEDLLESETATGSEAKIAARAQEGASPAIRTAIDRADLLLRHDRLLTDLGAPADGGFMDVAIPDGAPHEQGEGLARALRDRMGLGFDDLPAELDAFAALLEQKLGVNVAFESFQEGLDGLCVSRDAFRLILVSSRVAATRQRYTLAHELGHLVAGDSQDIKVDENVWGVRTPMETRANAFAAAFLMPAETLRETVREEGINDASVAKLLGRLRVSLDALSFRLHNIGAVNAEGRDRIRAMSSNAIYLRAGRASDLQARNDRRVPMPLLSRSMKSFVHGDIGVRPLADLVGMDPGELLEELSPPSKVASNAASEEMIPVL